MKHDWLVAAVTFVAAVAVNAVLYAYGQGQLEHRVETLEQRMEQVREDWKEGRERIEAAIKDLRDAIAK